MPATVEKLQSVQAELAGSSPVPRTARSAFSASGTDPIFFCCAEPSRQEEHESNIVSLMLRQRTFPVAQSALTADECRATFLQKSCHTFPSVMGRDDTRKGSLFDRQAVVD